MTRLERASETRLGVNRQTGALISGWDHVEQSIHTILRTRIGERIMRLDFGSNVPGLIDRPGSQITLARVYVAVTTALRRWEPGFDLRSMELQQAGADGQFSIKLTGTYLPRGHLGDRSGGVPASLIGSVGA